jgi:hypothetical protein
VKRLASAYRLLAIPFGVAIGALALTSAHAAEREKIDCHGGEITVSGEQRSVELANCAVIRIEGSHNNVAGVLPKRSKVYVTGDDNVVALHPVEGVSFSRLKDTGRDNKINGPG